MNMVRPSRRQFIAGLGVACAAAVVNGFVVEPRRIVVTRHQLGRPANGPFARSHRLVQITDLHLARVTSHTQRIARAVNELQPDLILFTGDMIDKADRVSALREFLQLLDRKPTKLATLGNWEHWARVNLDELNDAYASAGCRLLINETVRLSHATGDYLVTGLDDWTGGNPDMTVALRNVSAAPRHIIAAHSPVQRDLLINSSGETRLTAHETPCVLSGHTHGGQITLGGWAPVRPAGSGRYVAGWYRDASPFLYVCRGLGTSVVPIRFGATPEIACFEWNVAAA